MKTIYINYGLYIKLLIAPYKVRQSLGTTILYNLVSFPDLLAKAYLAKPLAAFGKTFVRRSGTRFGFLLVLRGVFGPIYIYFELNYLNFYSSLSYS